MFNKALNTLYAQFSLEFRANQLRQTTQRKADICTPLVDENQILALFVLNFDKISLKFVNFLQIYTKTVQILRKLTLKFKAQSVIYNAEAMSSSGFLNKTPAFSCSKAFEICILHAEHSALTICAPLAFMSRAFFMPTFKALSK